MLITADEARGYLADIENRYEEGRIQQMHEWITGANMVNDYDEDYVIDALFDIPNR